MNKKTFALIAFLFLVTCGLLYLALVTTPYKKPEVSLTPTPTPLSINAHTILVLMPAASASALVKPLPHQYTLAVDINTGGNSINAVQLELAYNPQALTNIALTPGNFFQQPNELVKSINTTDGRISYALTEQINLPGKKGIGDLAYLSFTIPPTFTDKTTTINFLPKTAVAADKILESVLKRATGYTVTIVQSTNSGTLTPAASGTTSAH